MENIQVAFGIDENDSLITALNRLHEVKLQIVSLTRARCTRHQHVTFEIVQREENRCFFTLSNRMKRSYATEIARSTLVARQRLTFTLRRQYFVGVLWVPCEAVSHVLHLVLLR